MPGLPSPERRFYAFELTPVSSTRVIILGQDPYHTPGKANGLAFGIAKDWQGNRFHSSFSNLMYEVSRSSGFRTDTVAPEHFNEWATLEGWARQGVFLTNTRLSVAVGQPMSHANLGWEYYVMRALFFRIQETNPVLVAFGAEARQFYEKTLKYFSIPADKVTVLAYSHPCKYSCTRGSKYAKAFKGSDCFTEINRELLNRGQTPINWWKVYP